jgi:hypothetical protein
MSARAVAGAVLVATAITLGSGSPGPRPTHRPDCDGARIIEVAHLLRTDGREVGRVPASPPVDGTEDCLRLVAASGGKPVEPCKPRTGSPASPYYDIVYCPAFARLNFYFETSFPHGPARGRVLDAAAVWNRTGRSFELHGHSGRPLATIAVRRAGSGISFARGDCQRTLAGRPASVVKWAHIDGRGGIAGATSTCFLVDAGGKAYTLRSFALALDRDEHWYTGGSRGPAGDQIDLESVAVHEIGHSSGWNVHLDDRAPRRDCPRADARGFLVTASVTRSIQTMCRLNAIGTTSQRTLGGRDRRVFRGAYR